jgi:hypothetical protein
MKKSTILLIVLILLTSATKAQLTTNNNKLEDKSPPSTPTNLTATGSSSTQMYLSWDDVTDETAYYIYITVGGPYMVFDSTAANVTFYYHNGLTPQSQYCYKVSAYNQDGWSGLSNEACGSTLAAINETQLNNPQIIIYPDPTIDNIIINIQSLNTNRELTTSIYNIQGELLLRQSLHQDKTEINISNLDKGVYIVRVFGTDMNMIKKIIKE